MLALAYDAALRREELCSLQTSDLDPARRTLRVRAETTKNRRERVVPYSAVAGELLSGYLARRSGISQARGPLFLSESRRNHAQPLSLWTWSKGGAKDRLLRRWGGGAGVSAPLAVLPAEGGDGRWRWPIDRGSYDTTPAVRAAETAAIAELGVGNLRRLSGCDLASGRWQPVRRLLRPLDDAAGALESPPTSHRRRAMLDASAVVLLQCAQAGRSYWAWTDEEWAALIGRDQDGFRKAAPAWADDAVLPYLAAHAFLLGGFTAFCRLGRLHRLILACG
jgi:Phage integrase family